MSAPVAAVKINAVWKYRSGDTTGCTRRSFAPRQNAIALPKNRALSLDIAYGRASSRRAVKVKWRFGECRQLRIQSERRLALTVLALSLIR
jgi:hypothetical protein